MILLLLPRGTVWCVAPPRTGMMGRERELEGRAFEVGGSRPRHINIRRFIHLPSPHINIIHHATTQTTARFTNDDTSSQ
eukprot:scaffold826_cov231-Alexandrium_tamarense.AAC.3